MAMFLGGLSIGLVIAIVSVRVEQMHNTMQRRKLERDIHNWYAEKLRSTMRRVK